LKIDHLFKFNESLSEIVCKPNGQKILFRGLDDPLKITSISVDVGMPSWAWFEEAYQCEDMGAVDTVIVSSMSYAALGVMSAIFSFLMIPIILRASRAQRRELNRS